MFGILCRVTKVEYTPVASPVLGCAICIYIRIANVHLISVRPFPRHAGVLQNNRINVVDPWLYFDSADSLENAGNGNLGI